MKTYDFSIITYDSSENLTLYNDEKDYSQSEFEEICAEIIAKYFLNEYLRYDKHNDLKNLFDKNKICLVDAGEFILQEFQKLSFKKHEPSVALTVWNYYPYAKNKVNNNDDDIMDKINKYTINLERTYKLNNILDEEISRNNSNKEQ